MHQGRQPEKNHRYPIEIVARAVWLYFRFNLSLRDVEEMLLDREIVVSYETIRRWCRKLGPDYARRLRRKAPTKDDVWHLDGLDVSMKETAISIRRAGTRVWRGKCASDPKLIAQLVHKRAPGVKRVVFETGRCRCGFIMRCALKSCRRSASMPVMPRPRSTPNKTDATDADGLAHLEEVGFYREVRVKGLDSMLTRTLVAARARLLLHDHRIVKPDPQAHEDLGLIVPAGCAATIKLASSTTIILAG